MKLPKWGYWLLLSVLVGVLLSNLIFAISPLSEINQPYSTRFFHGIDFTLRLNEIDCIIEGIDPYEIRTGKIDKPPYYSFVEREKAGSVYNKPLDVYTPWEYTFMMPFSLMPRQVAWCLHIGFKFLSLAVIGIFAYFFAQRKLCFDIFHSWLFALFSLFVITFPTWRDFENGNFGVTITAAVLLMAVCLNRNHQVMAGIMWAFAMFKPQMALPFVIPLLLKRRYLTIVVAAGICLIGAILPAIMVHTSPVGLVIHALFGGVKAFVGCGTLPYPVVCMMRSWGVPDGVSILLAMLIGGGICFGLTWRLRNSTDWLWLFLPAAGCAVSWTYTGWSNYCLNVVPFMLLTLVVCQGPTFGAKATYVISLLWLSCSYIGFYEVSTTCSGIMSWCQMPEWLHQTLHTFEMTFILATTVFVAFKLKRK